MRFHLFSISMAAIKESRSISRNGTKGGITFGIVFFAVVRCRLLCPWKTAIFHPGICKTLLYHPINLSRKRTCKQAFKFPNNAARVGVNPFRNLSKGPAEFINLHWYYSFEWIVSMKRFPFPFYPTECIFRRLARNSISQNSANLFELNINLRANALVIFPATCNPKQKSLNASVVLHLPLYNENP